MSDEKEALKRLNESIKGILCKESGISPDEISLRGMTTIPPVIMFRPNNYRKAVEVRYDRNSILKKLQSTIGTIGICKHTNGICKHTKIVTFRYKGITFQLGKKKLMAIYSQSTISKKKITYKVEADTIDEQCSIISNKVKEIEKEIDGRIGEICRLFSITMMNSIEWVRYEDWGKGIEIIDKIPKDTIVHFKHWKKVYPTGIELLKTGKEDRTEPAVKLNRMIENSALQRQTPIIANEISKVWDGLKEIKETMNLMSNEVSKSIIEIAKETKFMAENLNIHIPYLKELKISTEKQGRSSERLADAVEKLTKTVEEKPKRKYKHPSELMELPNWMRKKE